MSDSQEACLERLQEMDAALARMQQELPHDALPVGAEARRRVALWLERLRSADADLDAFAGEMREISRLMDSLAARLLLAPYELPEARFRS